MAMKEGTQIKRSSGIETEEWSTTNAPARNDEDGLRADIPLVVPFKVFDPAAARTESWRSQFGILGFDLTIIDRGYHQIALRNSGYGINPIEIGPISKDICSYGKFLF